MNVISQNISSEVAGGVALLLAALGALAFVNLGGAEAYHHLLEYPLTLGVAPFALEKTLHHWINDGLMVLFFLLVGIEIQRELRTGSLRNLRQAAVPVVAAIGGFVLPALVFLLMTAGMPEIQRGWSVPTATDIAFAVALVTVLKDHVPASLRVFLLALAVTDDLLAIAVIAIFYTTELVWMNLFLAGVGTVVLLIKNRLHIQSLWFYILVGLFMWLCVLQSGVHATVAGVLVGVLLPLKGKRGQPAPADTVEHALQPWVRWLVLPLFAFGNVGVDLTGMTPHSVFTPLSIAIALGLFAGKQAGVLGTVWVLEKGCGFHRPHGATWRQVYGIACLCGIGFTMSLFIGSLALPGDQQSHIRLGVLAGSALSALLAVAVLRSKKTGTPPGGNI